MRGISKILFVWLFYSISILLISMISSTLLSKGLSRLKFLVPDQEDESDSEFIRFLDYEGLDKDFDIHKYYPQHFHNGEVSTPELRELLAEKPVYANANAHIKNSRGKIPNSCGLANVNHDLKRELRALVKEQRQRRREIVQLQRQERKDLRRGSAGGFSFFDKDDRTLAASDDDVNLSWGQDVMSQKPLDDNNDEDLLVFKNPFDMETTFSKSKDSNQKVAYNGIYSKMSTGRERAHSAYASIGTSKKTYLDEKTNHSIDPRSNSIKNDNSSDINEKHSPDGEKKSEKTKRGLLGSFKESKESNGRVKPGRPGTNADHYGLSRVVRNNSLSNKVRSLIKRNDDEEEFGYPLCSSSSFDQSRSSMTDSRRASKFSKLKLIDKKERRASEQLSKYFFSFSRSTGTKVIGTYQIDMIRVVDDWYKFLRKFYNRRNPTNFTL